ncbi:odorant receptor 94a-like [Sitodiplosis mosellana]|uniref:odorant receptor 94a-like n=1 Tax=Sitodiplosis mosellana TaxID=263140 RepID=UPI002443CE1A|nr:odorant receptor 94a-like [Sitodiplosis mosellana]
MMMCILVGYMNILCVRLRSFGNDNSKEHKLELVNIFEMYIGISSKYFFRYSKLLEKLLSATLFLQFGVSAIILCISSYQISKITISEDMPTFVFSLTYIAQMLLEILIPSYFGSYVFLKGEEIPYAAFQSNWIVLNKDVKQSLRILMVRSMKPIQIHSAKTFTLNLTTMMKV